MKTFTHLYFLGIGGIGMSSLAEYFLSEGYQVAGYDREASDRCKHLEKLGVQVVYDAAAEAIPAAFRDAKQTRVVFTPAVPKHHPQRIFFAEGGFTLKKRAEVLGAIVNPRFGIAVAGSHGKTSVSSYIAYLLSLTEIPFHAFIGGIARNFNSNLVLNPGSNWVLAEADEFDRSFLQLFPNIAVVTSLDADHLDVYGHWSDVKAAFQDFVRQIKADGALVVHQSVADYFEADSEIDLITYGSGSDADVSIRNVRVERNAYWVDIYLPDNEIWKDCKVHLPGRVNLENALAMISVAWLLDIPESVVRETLAGFMGVKRRFDYRIKTPQLIYIDDYAHHPAEIQASLASVRELYPDKKISLVFQPHLYSRTRDFASEFASALNTADEVFLLDIYPAREEPIPGVSSELILSQLDAGKAHIIAREELIVTLKQSNLEVLITMGAGNIDALVQPIVQELKKAFHL